MTPAIALLLELFPKLLEWIQGELSAGRDPKAQLESQMRAAELAAEASEDAKFGPATPNNTGSQ